MTDTPPVLQDLGFPEGWTDQPIYPSSLFGGARNELWTPRDTGALFIGWALINDGLTVLQDLMNTPADTDETNRAEVISLAVEWLATCGTWTNNYAAGQTGDTDRGTFLRETTRNMIFLSDSMQEHVHRLGKR